MNLIGQGGTADVFRAKQGSLERNIAIKVLRGDCSAEAQSHFSAEAKITGGLDHPNIVPIHDLLTLPSGAKALFMKHVDGETWLKRLKSSRASGCFDLARELAVLCDICDAVAFAHSRGVIHLDIKPANVMVGEYGQTLLMDWGCAAIVDEARWRNQPELPRAKELIHISGTPIYMAPEQAIGAIENFGKVTDIYALGTVLYNLIAGTDMRHGEDIKSVLTMAALGTIPPLPSSAPLGLGKICFEAVNPDPSQRTSTATKLRERINEWLNTRESRQLTENALNRLQVIEAEGTSSDDAAIELKELLSLLQRSLESWPQNTLAEQGVVDTAHKLAAIAIKRDEPALAAQYANLLPLQHPQRERLLRIAGEITKRQAHAKTRSKILSFALWGLGATIIAALIAISTLFVRVDTERQRAVALKTFSSHMLTSVDPAIAQGMDNALMMEVLRLAIVDAEATFGDEPLLLSEVQSLVAESYMLLDMLDEATELNNSALTFYRDELGDNAEETIMAILRSVEIMAEQNKFAVDLEVLASSEILLRDAVERSNVVFGEFGDLTLKATAMLAHNLWQQDRTPEAMVILDDLLPRAERELGLDNSEILNMLSMRGILYSRANMLAEAEETYIEVYRRFSRSLGESDPKTITSMLNLGMLYHRLGDYERADPYLRQGLEARERLYNSHHPTTLRALANVVLNLANSGDTEEAGQLAEEYLRRCEERFGPDSIDCVQGVINSAKIAQAKGDVELEGSLLRQAVELFRQEEGSDFSVDHWTVYRLAFFLTTNDQHEEAYQLRNAILADRTERLGPEDPSTLTALNNTAIELRKLERYDEAEELYLELIERRERVMGLEDPSTLTALNNLGSMYYRMERFEEAVPLLERSYLGRDELLGAEHNYTMGTMMSFAGSLIGVGSFDEARALLGAELEGRLLDSGDTNLSSFLTHSIELALQADNLDESVRLVDLYIQHSSDAEEPYSRLTVQIRTLVSQLVERGELEDAERFRSFLDTLN